MTHAKTCWLYLLQFALVSTVKASCPMPELKYDMVMSEISILHNSFPENIEVFLECANGFERESGSVSIICTGGTWSGVELQCRKIDCGEPKPSPHMYYIIQTGTLFGDYVKPKCDRGYYLEGSSYRQCLVTGWSGKSSCSLITCDKPIEIKNGRIITEQYKEEPVLDDVIEYSCNDNYVLVGNKTVTCNEDGEYSSPPTCEETKQQTEANMATDIPTITSGLYDIKQTESNMTTDIPTTTRILYEDIKQTEANMTTDIPTTTRIIYDYVVIGMSVATFLLILR